MKPEGFCCLLWHFWYTHYFHFKNKIEAHSKHVCISSALTLPHPLLRSHFWCVIVLNKIILYLGAGEINVFYYRIGAQFISIHYILCTAIAGSQLGDEPQPLISSWLEAISSALYKIPDSSLPHFILTPFNSCIRGKYKVKQWEIRTKVSTVSFSAFTAFFSFFQNLKKKIYFLVFFFFPSNIIVQTSTISLPKRKTPWTLTFRPTTHNETTT